VATLSQTCAQGRAGCGLANATFTRCNDYDSRHSRFLVTLFDMVYSELFVIQPDMYRLLYQAGWQCIAQLERACDG
jgi:hypothetical protein